MRSSIRRVGFPVALLVTACVQGRSLSLADRDAAGLAIAQNYRAYETALNNADAGAIAALYTADGVFLRADTTENVRGTAALHAYLTALFGDSTRYSGTSITSYGPTITDSLAVDNGITTAMVQRGAAAPVERSWKWMAVSVRQPDGSWKIQKLLAAPIRTTWPVSEPPRTAIKKR